MRGDLRPWAEKFLFGPCTQARGLRNPRGVADLWRRMRAGELETIGKIAPLVSLELMSRYLFDGDDWRSLPVD